MTTDNDALRDYLARNFAAISLTKPLPVARALSSLLNDIAPDENNQEKRIDAESAQLFATAAVDMWHRSVHSFLISASLTGTSPIWSAITGYYSSHYSVRGLAHLLGNFQLFKKSKLVHLRYEGSQNICLFKRKPDRGGGEHRIYWNIVKTHSLFQEDPLFTKNESDSDTSDVRHRNHANYADHLFMYPQFTMTNEDDLKERIERISTIALDDAPLPRMSRFPDLEFVQLIAYHRLVRFRNFLDDVLGNESEFWMQNRSPAFASTYMDFQIIEGSGLTQPSPPQ
jgi:hypothetical protein